jgi:hypothetical protein
MNTLVIDDINFSVKLADKLLFLEVPTSNLGQEFIILTKFYWLCPLSPINRPHNFTNYVIIASVQILPSLFLTITQSEVLVRRLDGTQGVNKTGYLLPIEIDFYFRLQVTDRLLSWRDYEKSLFSSGRLCCVP